MTYRDAALGPCSSSVPSQLCGRESGYTALCPQVEDLNAKWQRYDASREEYVRELRAQLREPPAPEPEMGQMRKEISRLNRQLETRISECAGAARELAAARERAQMLEQQVGQGTAGQGSRPPPASRTAAAQ